MSGSMLLTPRELKELRRLCSSPERELASTWRAEHLKCLESRETRRAGRLKILFPSDAAAIKWNTRHETQIRHGGHLVSAGVTTLVTILGGPAGPAAGIAVATLAAIVKDEIQAKVWYPRVARGWTLTIDHVCSYRQFPTARLFIDATYTVIDHKDRLQDQRAAAKCTLEVGDPNGVPDEVARRLVTRPTTHRTLTFA